MRQRDHAHEQAEFGAVLVQVDFINRYEPFQQKCDAVLDQPRSHFNNSLLPDVVCAGTIVSIHPSLLQLQQGCQECQQQQTHQFHQQIFQLQLGSRVVVYYSREFQHLTRYELPNTMQIYDTTSLIEVPTKAPIDTMACMSRELFFCYSAFQLIHNCASDLLNKYQEINILIIGCADVGLCTLRMMLQHGSMHQHIRLAYSDADADNVDASRKMGCNHFLHWKKEYYESEILSNTSHEMPQGLDIVVDFVSSFRTLTRSLKLLNKGGTLFLAGNSTTASHISMDAIFRNNISIVPLRLGSRESMKEFFNIYQDLDYRTHS